MQYTLGPPKSEHPMPNVAEIGDDQEFYFKLMSNSFLGSDAVYFHQYKTCALHVYTKWKALRCAATMGILRLRWLLCASYGFGGQVQFWKPETICLLKPFMGYIQPFDGAKSCLQPCFPTNDSEACWAKERSVLEDSIDQHILMCATSISEAWTCENRNKRQPDNACTWVSQTHWCWCPFSHLHDL